MQTMTPPSPGRVIFREGLIFGVLIGVVHILLSLINSSLAQSGLSTLGFLLIIIVWLGGYFWAGVRGAKKLVGLVQDHSLALSLPSSLVSSPLSF